MTAHADASPSSAGTWLNCPASVTLARGRKRKATIYTAEGSAAHEVAELLIHGLPAPDEVVVEGFTIAVDDDMVDAVERYVDYVEQLKAKSTVFLTETKVNVLTPGGEPLWGTADVIAYQRDKDDDGELEVVDLKYGRGVAVSAKDNPQLRIYALGAIRELDRRKKPRSRVPITNIRLTIIQPRTESDPGENHEELDLFELIGWRDTILLPAISKIDLGDKTEVVGPWCRWCVRAGECRTLAGKAQGDARMVFDANSSPAVSAATAAALSDAELAAILDQADFVISWIEKVRAEASARIDHGKTIPGWKLAAKRAMRRWIDADTALAELRKRFPKLVASMVKVVTPTQVEAILKRAKLDTSVLAIGGPLVVKESSGTTLVREADPRPATLGSDAKTVFEQLTESLDP
jgi:hypothetical protein